MKLRAVPFTQVSIEDDFWQPRQETNRRVSIPQSLDMLEQAGNLHNFELAAQGAREGYSGPVFMDSDLYKVLEAVACSLATHPDPELDRRADAVIAQIAAAQCPDGYLNTWYQINAPDRRWTNLRDDHELYCAGHLFEAAVAHFQATGKRSLLEVATRFADCIDRVFGDAPGKRMGYCGHPEIELALMKLGRAVEEPRYLRLARFFIENRGRRFFAEEHGTPPDQYDGTYWQDDLPITEHNEVKGHAVRAVYLMSGVVDVAEISEDGAKLLSMVDRVWHNTCEKRMYVTGGIGPSAHNEGFTVDYDLPNLTAYQETCASVAMILWNHRLNLLRGESHYADLMERALYNGFLAGVSLDGERYFYVNPLESEGGHHRRAWYSCACCPPNVTRTLAALGGYLYAQTDEDLYVNLYAQATLQTALAGADLTARTQTRYPWEGDVRITFSLDRPVKFGLHLRVPNWCEGASLRLNDGANLQTAPQENGYLVLRRTWSDGDTVTLSLPMHVQQIEAHPQVQADRGRFALQRGPLIYCLEACDHSVPITEIVIPRGAALTPRETALMGGIVSLQGQGGHAPAAGWEGRLYRAAQPLPSVPVTAIPYYAWDNREPGAMRVWIPY